MLYVYQDFAIDVCNYKFMSPVTCIIFFLSLQSVYPPLHSSMYKLFNEQESERVRLATAHLAEQVSMFHISRTNDSNPIRTTSLIILPLHIRLYTYFGVCFRPLTTLTLATGFLYIHVRVVRGPPIGFVFAHH